MKCCWDGSAQCRWLRRRAAPHRGRWVGGRATALGCWWCMPPREAGSGPVSCRCSSRTLPVPGPIRAPGRLLVSDLEGEPVLEAVVVGKTGDPDRGAAAKAGRLAEDVAEQVGGAVGHQVDVDEPGRDDHEVERADQRRDPVERAERQADGGQAVDRGEAGGGIALLDGDLGAEAAGVQRGAVGLVGARGLKGIAGRRWGGGTSSSRT